MSATAQLSGAYLSISLTASTHCSLRPALPLIFAPRVDPPTPLTGGRPTREGGSYLRGGRKVGQQRKAIWAPFVPPPLLLSVGQVHPANLCAILLHVPDTICGS